MRSRSLRHLLLMRRIVTSGQTKITTLRWKTLMSRLVLMLLRRVLLLLLLRRMHLRLRWPIKMLRLRRHLPLHGRMRLRMRMSMRRWMSTILLLRSTEPSTPSLLLHPSTLARPIPLNSRPPSPSTVPRPARAARAPLQSIPCAAPPRRRRAARERILRRAAEQSKHPQRWLLRQTLGGGEEAMRSQRCDGDGD